MEKIIKNISKNMSNKKNKNNKNNDVIQFELELNYKIECEKTKQLQLIKDIKKIEKNIREKEIYNKSKKILYSNINNCNNCNNCTKCCKSDSEDSDLSDSSDESVLSDGSDLSDGSENSVNSDTLSMHSYISEKSYREIEIN